MKILSKIIIGFLRFWYDFIIGDCWQLALGVGVVLAAAVALVRSAALGPGVVAVLVAAALMALVVLTAAFEWWRKSARQSV
jgi:hypothetical protein